MRNNFLHLALVLMLIAGTAAGALALVNSYTAPRIAAAKEAALQEALVKTLPGAVEFQEDADFLAAAREEDADFRMITAVYRAYDADGNAAGVIVTVTPQGFSGPIETMVGVGGNGRISAVRVLSQTETPGLGTKAARPAFLDEFAGARTGQELAVNKDGGAIDAVAGATISSRAVTAGINLALSIAQRAGY